MYVMLYLYGGLCDKLYWCNKLGVIIFVWFLWFYLRYNNIQEGEVDF